MRRDSSVFLLGEDIGVYGGAFKVTKGFIEEFGPAVRMVIRCPFRGAFRE